MVTWSYWPIKLFWKTFGVFPVDLYDHRTPVLFTAFSLISSIYVLLYTLPKYIVGIQYTTETMEILKEIFSGMINATSLLSRIALLYTVKFKFQKYKETLECYELYSPTTPSEVKCCKTFTFIIVAVCGLLIIPVNIVRLLVMFGLEEINGFMIALYIFNCIQNLTMCCSETQFTAQCFILHNKLKKLNDEIIGLKGSPIDFSRYLHPPSQITDRPTCDGGGGGGQCNCSSLDVSSPAVVRTAAVVIEALRIRHWLIREAIGHLNYLFNVQLCVSVCVLPVMLFFDLYEICHEMRELSLSNLIAYNWLLQYGTRYTSVILISHFTIRQVGKHLP